MSKYDYIMDIVKSKMSQGADYAKSIPGKLGVDGSSRFERFARRHADTPLSELENMSNKDYILDDIKNNFKENWNDPESQLPFWAGVGGGAIAGGIYNHNKQEELQQLYDDYMSGMSIEELIQKYPDIDIETIKELETMEM